MGLVLILSTHHFWRQPMTAQQLLMSNSVQGTGDGFECCPSTDWVFMWQEVIWSLQNLSFHARLTSSFQDTRTLMHHAILNSLFLCIITYKLKEVTFDTSYSWHNLRSQSTNYLTAARNSLITHPASLCIFYCTVFSKAMKQISLCGTNFRFRYSFTSEMH